MKKLEELLELRALEIKIENDIKAEKEEAQRIKEEKRNILIARIILLVICIVPVVIIFINWVGQFNGSEIAITVFIILVVIGLIGRLFGN
jgi:uncharacterized ion transporter superfamily protein YfcC